MSRNYSRYGIREEWFRDDLLSISKPDLVLITSLMTYWHPGVQETISIIKETFPDTPVILGGVYASLCEDHANINSGADMVVTGPAAQHILKLAEKFTGFAVSPKYNPDNSDTYPYPAFDLQKKNLLYPYSHVNRMPLFLRLLRITFFKSKKSFAKSGICGGRNMLLA